MIALWLVLACGGGGEEITGETPAPRAPAQGTPAAPGPPVQGLVDAPGRTEVLGNCTACHSTALILQNRMSRAEWDRTITWMQAKHKLWELPPQTRVAILDYLAQTQGVEEVMLLGDHGSPWHRPRYPANPVEWD